MERWANKKILIVGKTIQKRLFKDSTKNQSSDMKGTPFARFMEDGKVTKSLKVLENANKGGILPLTDEIFKVLLRKSPKASKASNDRKFKGFHCYRTQSSKFTFCNIRQYWLRNG